MPERKKFLPYLFPLFALGTLFFLLSLRFLESITRSFGPDELSHLHMVYLLSQGLTPYRDFFTLYSPLFHFLFLPLFSIFGESFAVLIMARIFVFILSLLGVLLTFLICRLLTKNTTFALFAAVVSAFLPLAAEKIIEIRPDNLMNVLFLAGVYFCFLARERKSGVFSFLSGVFFALSFWVLPKIIFPMTGFFFSIALYEFLGKKRKVTVPLLIFFTGGCLLPTLLLLSGFYWQHILSQALTAIFTYSQIVISALRFGNELHPFFWFFPNDAVYGKPSGLAFYTSNLIILLSLAGMGITLYKFLRTKKVGEMFIFILPSLFSFFSLFLVRRPFLQYLLPFLLFVPIWTAYTLEKILQYFSRSAKLMFSLFLLTVMIVTAWESWEVKKYWGFERDKRLIEYILTNTSKEDRVWGRDGSYVFRKDGYFVYYFGYFEFPDVIIKSLPPLIPSLEKTRPKYLLFSPEALRQNTWPFDNVDAQILGKWILADYHEAADYSGLWVRK